MRILGTGEETMHEQARQAYRKQSIVLALVALVLWALVSFFLPWAAGGSRMMLFGLPLSTALAVPVALPIFVLTMFWVASRQNREDDQFPDD